MKEIIPGFYGFQGRGSHCSGGLLASLADQDRVRPNPRVGGVVVDEEKERCVAYRVVQLLRRSPMRRQAGPATRGAQIVAVPDSVSLNGSAEAAGADEA